MIKALVADDSGLMRLIVSDILSADSNIEVIGTAVDGKDATEKTCQLKPDIVILDMNMGEYDGKYAIKEIMAKCPVPILILSALGNSDLDAVMEAMHLGAVDYINKPDKNNVKIRDIGSNIVSKVKYVAQQANKNAILNKKANYANNYKHTFPDKLNYDVVVIGSSTGGPTAVEKVITKLPENMPVPVLIAQHMPNNFISSFVSRLDALTPLRVQVGIQGEVIAPGNVYIAPGDRNLMVTRALANKVKLDYDPKHYREFNNPSVNALMLSVAEVYKERAIGVILTGMGKDGAEGLKAIKEAGGFTIGQDKKTSVVYGMPREVNEKGYSREVVSIDGMSGFIVSCLD